MGRLNIDQRWPELFDGLSEKQRYAVIEALAGAWHEGWEPNREDVADLTAKVRGDIDRDEYVRRARQRIEQQHH